ncbi:V-type ATPase assembly factor PKR1 [Smittium culicis]|uniref:V-type ATPase assembly factor PKR1 n=1 Tax=Smittium culicis TaxID=133412 RepID=A0A1R1WZX2_9FUNG|nr:V-type ATPase assembly factor PKR1 [Smittium culicis]
MTSAGSESKNSVLGDVVDSVVSGGVNNGVMKVFNVAFAALFLVLSSLIYLTGPNLYLVAIMVINAFLFSTIQYIVAEYYKAKNSDKDGNKKDKNESAEIKPEQEKPKKVRKRI